MQQAPYKIGTPGQKWGQAEKQQWFALQQVKRSYQQQVLAKLTSIPAHLSLVQYGNLSIAPEQYPLFCLQSNSFNPNKANILITGGVHGYETSGVQGAIEFALTHSQDFINDFNFVIAVCISPWGYETINRWNPHTVDPNRAFFPNSPAEESAKLMAYIASLNLEFLAHFDLHETTDTDNTEFRPALAARDATTHDNWNIPDGFYLVDDSEHSQPAFQTAIIKSVEQVTHIAPADNNNQLIGVTIEQHGVINYNTKKLGLCAGMTNAPYVTTTEVYPDSPKVNDNICINAQVAAICGGLNYLKAL